MKRNMLLTVAILMAAAVSAQTEVNLAKMFDVQDKYIELNDPATVKNGVVFVGDTRPADKVTDGKYKGMRVQKLRRNFMLNGKSVQFTNALSFRRAPQGATKDHKVDVNLVPRSCMIQLKPASSGQLTFCAQTNKEEDTHVYIAIRNGSTFRPLASLTYKKDEAVTGRKDAPYPTQSCDYSYADGDELWIYSDGSINLFAMQFSGKTDATFTGSDPVEVSKAVRRAMKK